MEHAETSYMYGEKQAPEICRRTGICEDGDGGAAAGEGHLRSGAQPEYLLQLMRQRLSNHEQAVRYTESASCGGSCGM